METIVYENFKSIPNKTGIFALLNIESCFACNEYMKEIKQYNKNHWTIVALSDEDGDDLFEETGLKPPITRIYVNDRIEYEVGGVLYHKQIKDLFDRAATLGLVNDQGREIKAPQSFNVIEAKQRDIRVQAFQAQDFLNVELLGQEVIARKGQWIVLYPDNFIEVLDKEAYERRF
jgi:hypothetical protein